MSIKLVLITISSVMLLSGCGTFPLASGTIPLSPKTKDEIQLDTLMCKDKAKLEANTADRQAGAFALGLTIVGAPLAYQLERDKQREVFKTCMETKNYKVIPVEGEASSPEQSKQASPTNTNLSEQLTKLKDLKNQNLISQEEYDKKKSL